MDIFVHYRWAG